MGRFSTLIQVFNSKHLTREQFVDEFTKIMESTGYFQLSNDEFDLSYYLAFSTNGRWVTIGSEDYIKNHNRAFHDAQQIAQIMQTSSFSIEVVDSDWADIQLYTKSNDHDTVIVGRSEFYTEGSPKGRQDCWINLLIEGKSWNELLNAWNKNEVFVEDALLEAASLLGIEAKYMFYDYEDFKYQGEDDSNINQIFFRKK